MSPQKEGLPPVRKAAPKDQLRFNTGRETLASQEILVSPLPESAGIVARKSGSDKTLCDLCGRSLEEPGVTLKRRAPARGLFFHTACAWRFHTELTAGIARGLAEELSLQLEVQP
jgi:hypothetical protein